MKRLFILILIAAFVGSNVYLITTSFTFFNFFMFLLLCYILVFTKREYDRNFIFVLGIIGTFILIGFIYLILFYRDFEQIKDFIYMTYILNIFFIIFTAIKESKIDFFRSFLNTLLTIEFFLLLIALFEAFTGRHLPSSTYYYEKSIFIPTTVFTNPNDLSAIVVLFFPVLYYLADYFKSKSKKRFLTLMTIAIVILTMSRVAMAMLLVYPLFNLLIKRKLLRFTFISFSLMVIFIIIFNLKFKYLPNENSLFVRNYNRFITLVNIKDNFSNKSSSFNERSQVLLIIWENPAEFIFGKGFRAGAVIIPEKKHLQIVDPHSFFLEVIYNFGYFALIPVALLIFIPLYYSLKYFGRNSIYRLGLVQTFYFVILINVSSSVFRFPLVWVPFAVSYMMIITVNDNILPEF